MSFYTNLSDPEIAKQLGKVNRAKSSLVRAEKKLAEMRAACMHGPGIIEQSARVGANDGRQVFLQKQFCQKCGLNHETRSVMPVCLSCGEQTVEVDRRDEVDHHDEFIEAVLTSRDGGSVFSRRGYRCISCQRVHVYHDDGD